MLVLQKGLKFNWDATDEQRATFHYARSLRPLRPELLLLLVEDQRFFQHVFRSAFDLQQKVIIASNAEEGWRMYLEHAPDIAFLDIMMDGMNGLELAWGLNQLDKASFLVMLSGMNDIETMALAQEIGASDFITKPYSKKKLLDCLVRYKKEFGKLMD